LIAWVHLHYFLTKILIFKLLLWIWWLMCLLCLICFFWDLNIFNAISNRLTILLFMLDGFLEVNHSLLSHLWGAWLSIFLNWEWLKIQIMWRYLHPIIVSWRCVAALSSVLSCIMLWSRNRQSFECISFMVLTRWYKLLRRKFSRIYYKLIIHENLVHLIGAPLWWSGSIWILD